MKTKLLLMAFAALLLSQVAMADAIITVGNTTTYGPTADVNVSINGVSDLYAFQFDAHFDPAVLASNGDTPGGMFVGSGNSFIGIGSFIDNFGGNYFSAGYTFFGASSGVSGDGVLLTLNFNTGGAPAFSFVTLDNIILLDSNLDPIAFTETDGSVSVVTPEPSSLFLLGSGMTGLVGVIRRRRRS